MRSRIITASLAAVMAAGLVGAATGTAEARDGCGLGFHRGPFGACRPNYWGYVGYGYGNWGSYRGFYHGYGWHGGFGWHHGFGHGWGHRW